MTLSNQPLHVRQRAFGYTQEDLRVLLAPMAAEGAEPVGSMGNDLSLAVLSDQAPPLFSYFKQLFAQVTNPPIDPIREEIVMSLSTSLGNERNLFEETPEHAHKLLLDQPILLNRELETLRARRTPTCTRPKRSTSPGRVAEGPAGMRTRGRAHLLGRRTRRSPSGVNIIILSDRALGPARVAIPSLLAVAATQHHLVHRGHPPARRHHPRVGRAPRGAPLRHPHRLRRERRSTPTWRWRRSTSSSSKGASPPARTAPGARPARRS